MILNSISRPLSLDIMRLFVNPSQALTAIHARHGDFVRFRCFNKTLVFVSKPEYLEEIYSLEAKGKLNRDFLHDILAPVFHEGLINSKHDCWSQQRRLMQPLFTKDAVQVWEAQMLAETRNCITKLQKSSATEVNLSNTLKNLIQTIFIKVLFGEFAPAQQQLASALDTALNGLLPRVILETLGQGQLRYLVNVWSRKYRVATEAIRNYVLQAIIQHDANTTGSLLSYLARAEDAKTGYTMSRALLQDEMIDLFIAGQDTTVNVLCWFFYVIGRNSSIHAQINEEIERYRSDSITQDNLDKLRYTRAVLYETMRHFPPAHSLARQAIEDVDIGGHRIKSGTAVIINIMGLHQNAHYWHKPLEFYPEHFLPGQAELRHRYAYLPFGGGVHTCIGRHFAELEMMIVITILLRSFTVTTENVLKAKASVTLRPEKDLLVTLTGKGKEHSLTSG